MSGPIKIQKFLPTQVNRGSAEQQQAKMRDAANLYEKMFLREMVKAMRQTVQPSAMSKPNMAEKIFREKLDGEYIESWGDQGGVGLAEIIYQQLNEKFGPHSGVYQLRPQGPVPIKQGTTFKIQDNTHQIVPINGTINNGQKDISYQINVPKAPGQSVPTVTSPWEGVVKAVADSEHGKRVEIEHENVNSVLTFPGQIEKLVVGQEVGAGQTLGKLTAEPFSLNWRLFSVV